ncbi:Cys-tRNA(Pro)/Cys-tRNA(Cys) deacylase [Ketogulonicigenium robustum]|uniref:Cys-tRNA(Pro)/Cys-tRNA(Cys) deacylase n=1 Tax=Ketogulonicigenium robustum TaxID=92947 RepID=A0A1W6NWD5_9RHOB|nr:YbaK/EbsC family protein [Ketogulonicigenium robustum]ARO13453.1 Cys-tRNA(Pro)/Cys-tRNA(Cys) deacylase [Ketogulonicigenium robustum]
MASTRGTIALAKAGIAFTLHPYTYDPRAEHTGVAAAEALGLSPDIMLKTLMIEVDGKPACVAIPVAHTLSMKRAAAAFGAKHAEMMAVPKAEKISGYHVGGIGPFGQMRPIPVAFEDTAMGGDTIYINAGQRGLIMGIAPRDALAFLKAASAPLVA